MKQRLFYLALAFTFSCLGTAQSFDWGKKFGGISEDTVRDMVVDNQGNCYITGYIARTAIFQEGTNPISITTYGQFGFFDIYVAKINALGVVLWVKNFGNAEHDYGNGISLDAQGNIYVTGCFQLTTDFNPGGQGGVMTSNGFQDLFVLKLDQNGNFIWVKGFGSANYEESLSAATDAAGNVYLAGTFFSSIDFDPSDNEYIMNVTSDTANGFLMKMNAAGEFQWAKQFGASGTTYSKFVKVAENGDIYVLGEFTGDCDLNPAADGEFLVESAGKDVYITHLDASGNFLNAYRSAAADQAGNADTSRLDVDASGNVYLIGNFIGSVDFDPAQAGTGEFTLAAESFFYNSFVLKMNAAGTPLWIKKITGNNMTLVYDVSVSDQNAIFISGYFTGVAEFDAINIAQQSGGLMDSFYAQLNENGEFQLAYPFAGTGGADTHQIEAGPENSIYLTSAYHETVDLDPFEGELMVTNSAEGYANIYLVKLTAGNLGVTENPIAQNTAIYPNPAANFVQINGKENFAGKAFKLYDINGRQILEGRFDHQQKITLNNLSKGSYILTVEDKHHFRLIKN